MYCKTLVKTLCFDLFYLVVEEYFLGIRGILAEIRCFVKIIGYQFI